jgi:hypothetical protein
VIRPRLQSRKKLIPTTTKTVDPAVDPAVSTPTPIPALAGTETGNATPRTANGDAQPNNPVAAKGRLLEAPEPGSEIQILELQSYNPVISYQNEIYSCTWSDMIGTNMFFSEHDEERQADPLSATEDYDLLGTSRIKLIGRKAKLTNKPGRVGGYRDMANDLEDEEKDFRPGKGFGSLRSSNPVVNRERKKQAKFLENLMETSSQEIEELNRRVVRGDADALRRLQMIYSEPDEQQADNGVPQAPPQTP